MCPGTRAVISAGSRSDSCDCDEAAGAIIGLDKTELVRNRRPSEASTTSNSQPWDTSTGATTDDYTTTTAAFP